MNAPALITRDSAADLRDLLNQYAIADRSWSPAIDGMTHDIADDIRRVLRAELGLSDTQISTLREALL